MSSIGNVFPDVLPERNRRNREITKWALELTRVSLVVAAAASILFAVTSPKVAIFALASYELFQMATNALEVLNGTIQVVGSLAERNITNQIFKNTLVIGPIFKIVNNIGR